MTKRCVCRRLCSSRSRQLSHKLLPATTAAAVCLLQRLSSSSDYYKGNSLDDQRPCQHLCPGLTHLCLGQEGK